MGRFLTIAGDFLARSPEEIRNDPLAQVIIQVGQALKERQPGLAEAIEALRDKPLKKLQRMLDIESVLEDLDIIEQSANTILQIKEDLIGPARRQKLQKVDIVEIVKETIRGFALPPGVVAYSVDGIVPPVRVDPTQIGRVLLNLVKNAMEAMDDQPSPRIFVAIRQANENFVTVDIADNGSGIPEEELTKIWLTFHTTKAKKGGTGLGLPSCLQTMERMGGKIGMTSEVGIGSTFTLHVPIFQPGDEELVS
jgi:two-component system NtrC family sensor kinase